MKTLRWMVLGIAVMMVTGIANAAEKACLVRLMGMDRKAEWQAMNQADFDALQKNLKLEEKFFPKAVEAAGKEWRADELNKKIPFPGSRLAPRKIMTSTEFESMEKAEAQLSRIQDQEAEKLERQLEREKKSRQTKSKSKDSKEGELQMAASAVQAKLNEMVVKAGGTAVEAPAIEAPADVKKDEKPDAKKEVKKEAKKEAKAGH